MTGRAGWLRCRVGAIMVVALLAVQCLASEGEEREPLSSFDYLLSYARLVDNDVMGVMAPGYVSAMRLAVHEMQPVNTLSTLEDYQDWHASIGVQHTRLRGGYFVNVPEKLLPELDAESVRLLDALSARVVRERELQVTGSCLFYSTDDVAEFLQDLYQTNIVVNNEVSQELFLRVQLVQPHQADDSKELSAAILRLLGLRLSRIWSADRGGELLVLRRQDSGLKLRIESRRTGVSGDPSVISRKGWIVWSRE